MLVLQHYPLKLLNSFRIAVFASHYVQFHTVKEIEAFCTRQDLKQTKFYILGGGSNILFIDNIEGYILHPKLFGIEILEETSCKVLVKAQAGVKWHDLVCFCVQRGYGGIENLSYIPGTVGAAPVQNIGAYGIELKDVLQWVEAIELSTGKLRTFSNGKCKFGYRTSIFKKELSNQYLITGVVLALHKEKKFCITYKDLQERLAHIPKDQLSLQLVSNTVIAIRKKKLPDYNILGNAGSFFQNPIICKAHYTWLKKAYPLLKAFSMQDENLVKISAAWLIEQAGLKGYRKGHVGVYEKHALVLVNYGQGSGKDVMHLVKYIQERIKAQFDIALIPEVNVFP